MSLSPPVRSFGGPREAGDFRFTSRQSDWQGGYNRKYYQDPSAPIEPRFWDSFNVTTSTQGEIQLAPLFERVQTDASDKKPILQSFNNRVYRFEGVTTPAVQYTADGTTWNNVTMTSGPTQAIRYVTIWKNQVIVAANAATPFVLSSSDVWTAFAAPVGGTNVDAVGVGPDDKILAWVNGQGLYDSIDGTTWVKRWPTANAPDEATCDLLDGSTGAVIIATRNANGSSIHEYFTPEGAATVPSVVTWIQERNTYFYICRPYAGAAYIGAKKGTGAGMDTAGHGLLWRKERGLKPQVVQEIGDDGQGSVPTVDFGIRAMVNDAEDLYLGVAQRAPDFAAVVGVPGLYWYNVDATGLESVSPDSAIETTPGNVMGKVYSAEVINGEILITTGTGTWKRSKTKYASQGYIDTSLYDLKAPDHIKTWRFAEILMEEATSTESCAFYYRVGTLTGAWLGGTVVTAAGAQKIPFPDDNPTLAQYKLNSRQIQVHLVLARGADETLQPRVTSLAIDAAQIKPMGQN